jgi:hypothetical protein
MALYLARRGYDVAVHFAGSRDEAEAVVTEIRALGQKAEAVQADLLIEAETAGLVGRAVEALGGPLTVLVNNASIFEHDSFESATRESWDRHIESNLRAPFVLIQHFAAQAMAPAMDAAGEPVAQALVVNMVDQRVWKLTPDYASYTVDADCCAGTCPAGAGECHRPRTDTARRAADCRSLCAATRSNDSGAGRQSRRHHRSAWILHRICGRYRPDDRS